jgi:hypothetical protein
MNSTFNNMAKHLAAACCIGVVSLISNAAFAIEEQQLQTDCKKISSYATAGQKAYQSGDYAKARDSFIEQVGWSESCQLSDSAIATAYNNVALTYIKQKDFLKARVWLLIDEHDKKSQYNLGLIKTELAKLSTDLQSNPKNPVGEYWQYAGKGAWNSITVIRKDQQYQISFAGLYMGLMAMYYGPNMGEFETLSPINNGKAIYQDQEYGNGCLIEMRFKADRVELDKKLNECGFGHNVYADGVFLRVE